MVTVEGNGAYAVSWMLFHAARSRATFPEDCSSIRFEAWPLALRVNRIKTTPLRSFGGFASGGMIGYNATLVFLITSGIMMFFSVGWSAGGTGLRTSTPS